MVRMVATTVALLVASTAQGQSQREAAFGFKKGMTLKQAKAAAPLKPVKNSAHYYLTTKPPKPVSPFVAYVVVVVPVAGLCKVIAHTEHQGENSSVLTYRVETVLGMLGRRYGTPSSQTEDATTWVNAQGPGTLVTMALARDDDGKRHVVVEYEFSNIERCREELAEGV